MRMWMWMWMFNLKKSIFFLLGTFLFHFRTQSSRGIDTFVVVCCCTVDTLSIYLVVGEGVGGGGDKKMTRTVSLYNDTIVSRFCRRKKMLNRIEYIISLSLLCYFDLQYCYCIVYYYWRIQYHYCCWQYYYDRHQNCVLLLLLMTILLTTDNQSTIEEELCSTIIDDKRIHYYQYRRRRRLKNHQIPYNTCIITEFCTTCTTTVPTTNPVLLR